MSSPSYNKWKSTTVYGNLSVRDLTNSTGSSVVEVASVDLSGNFLSRGASTFSKAVVCNALLADINANNKLTTKEYVDSAVSGGGTSILGTANTWTNVNTFQEPTNFSSISLTSGISSPYFLNRTTTDTTINLNSSGSNINIKTLPTVFTRTQTEPQPYINSSVCSCQVLQTINNFYDSTYTPSIITVNTPVSVRQTGSINVATNLSWSMTLNITNIVAKVYTNGVLQNTISGTINNQSTNQVARTFTCSYSSGGIRSFTLDRYFFNFSFDINLNNYPTGVMTVFVDATLALNMTINSYTGNFAVQQEPSIRFNTTISTYSDTGNTANRTLTYSPTSTNGTGYSAFSVSSSTSTTGTENLSVNTGTTYVNKIYTNGINQNTGTTTTNTLNNLTTSSLTTALLDAGDIATDTLTTALLDAGDIATDTLTSSDTLTSTNLVCNNTFNFLPVGLVISFVGSSVPANCGWLLCNGDVYNAQTNPQYQALYNVILNQFGGANNTNFQVPDYRGAFLRGAGTSGVAGYTTYTGQTINNPESHATQIHTHTINHNHTPNRHSFRVRSDGLSGVGWDIISSFPTGLPQTATGLSVPSFSGSSGNNTGTTNANETRPFSYSINYLIKY